MSTRAFIAYDFELANRGTFLNVLESAKEKGEPELLIHFPGAPDATKNQGSLWEKEVRQPIEAAEKFLAFTDLPNANVGYEIGYAFGKDKPVAVYRFGPGDHDWVKHPPLSAQIRHRIETVNDIHDAISNHSFLTLSSQAKGGDGVTILCPKKGGDVFFEQINPAWGWTRPPLDGWTTEKLPAQFPNAGCVVWLILPHDEGEKDRDGIENTVLAILAGYAKARQGMELHVLRHKNARSVADVKDFEKVFTGNAELKSALTIIQTQWQAKLAARAAPPPTPATPTTVTAPLVLPSLWSHHMPPHPHDPFPDTSTRFIGREGQLGSGSDAVDGMLERLKNPTRFSGGRAVQWIWAHGFGGMGKSWCLHRIRCLAEASHSQIKSLIIDWDKPDWLAPLAGEPRSASEVFDLLAIRLCQRLGAHAADLYLAAKARVAAAAPEHKRTRDRFEQHLQLANTGPATGADSHLIQRLREEDLWHEEPAKREAKLKILRENRLRHREIFTAWCRDCGNVDPAVICPTRELASGLRASISAAMQQYPLVVVLDTCEILSDDLDLWLRELFAPLITECAPLLLLMGSRLRPDLHQPKGSRRGWLAELPGAACRIEDFGESLRFQVLEIEYALYQLKRPVPGDHIRLAEVLHRVTLGVPLAVRGLLDLHEDGNDVLDHLNAPDAEDEPLSESEAVRKAIADVSERWLYNLETKPERAEDLQDIIALALLPVLDQRLMREYWHPKAPLVRLRELSHKYSLLSDGDLHPSVRSYLRRHWRDESNRPECLPLVLDCLAHHYANVSSDSPPTDRVQRVQHRIATLNLRSWREGDTILPNLAPVLCLARVYELEDLTLEHLLSELSLTDSNHRAARKLWHRDDGRLPDNEEILPWLRSQRAASQIWTAEEDAALALLEGINIDDWRTPLTPATAAAAFAHLEQAFEFFRLEALPLSAAVGAAYFSVGYSLNYSSPEFARMAVSAYERAIALHCWEAVSYHNAASLYSIDLDQPEKAEEFYCKAIALDPKDANPHYGLANLYQYYFQQPEKAKESYLNAIALDPNDANPHHRLGNLYHDHFQQMEKAEQSYLKAIALDPQNADPHNGLGSLHEEAGRWSQGVVEYQQAIALNAKSSRAYRGLAWVALRSAALVEDARRWAEQAMALEPGHPGSSLVSIAVEVWSSDWTQALASWSEWVSSLPRRQEKNVWPSHKRIAALLRRIQAAGRLDEFSTVLRASLRPCWQPFAQAVDVLLQGRDAATLAEARCAAVFRLLQTPDPTIAPPPPKTRKRKKP